MGRTRPMPQIFCAKLGEPIQGDAIYTIGWYNRLCLLGWRGKKGICCEVNLMREW